MAESMSTPVKKMFDAGDLTGFMLEIKVAPLVRQLSRANNLLIVGQ